MRKLIAIIVAKLIYFVGGLVGKGSSYPGKIALKICPDILSQLKFPKVVIAITGSNGKTSTTEMVAAILKEAGKSVAYNDKGSNQIEGVTTTALHFATLGGVIKEDVLLLESDERYAKFSFKYFHPTHYVITNLYRDQLTRNGHPDWVYDAIEASIHGPEMLILNADDPLVSKFGAAKDNVRYFGLAHASIDEDSFNGAYNDGQYCPVCKSKMEYDYYHYNHIGAYHCTGCDFRRMDAKYEVTDVDLDAGYLTINNEDRISLALKSIYNIYNILAAYSVCCEIGIDSKVITKVLSDYVLKNGRFLRYKLGGHEGTFLVSKHENSVSYDMSIKYAVADKDPHSVIIIVDAISRKYFTSETSWLWDINFELLNDPCVTKIYLCGKYCHDLALRFEFTGINKERITLYESIDEACNFLKNEGQDKLYTITCFSDRMKFLSNVEVL